MLPSLFVFLIETYEIKSKRTSINQTSDYEMPGMERLFIDENLTGYRKMLFNKAKKLQKEHGYDFCGPINAKF